MAPQARITSGPADEPVAQPVDDDALEGTPVPAHEWERDIAKPSRDLSEACGSVPPCRHPGRQTGSDAVELAGAMRLARELMDEHGLREWQLAGDEAKRRAGACRHGTRTISLSRPLTRLHDETEVRETVLHEIAHALAGPAAGHGPQWQRIAIAIGFTGARCVDADAPRLEGDWRGRCPAGHEADRHRRPTRVLLCTRCPLTLPPLQRVMRWTFLGTEAPMHPNYRAELETLHNPGERLPRIGDVVQLQVHRPLAGATARVTAARRTRSVVDVAGRSYVVAKGACQPASR